MAVRTIQANPAPPSAQKPAQQLGNKGSPHHGICLFVIPDDVEWRHYGRTTKNGVQFVALLDRSAALLDWRRGAHFGTRHHRHLVELGPAAHSAHRARARAPVPLVAGRAGDGNRDQES